MPMFTPDFRRGCGRFSGLNARQQFRHRDVEAPCNQQEGMKGEVLLATL